MSMTAPPRIELAFCATALRPVVASYLAPVLKAYVAAFYSGGVQAGGRVTVTATDGNFWTSLDVPPPGTYTVRLFSEDGLTLVSETAPFTVPGAGAATSTPVPTPTPTPTPAPAPAPAAQPFTFTNATLVTSGGQAGSINVKIANASNGSPVTAAQLGLSTSPTAPPSGAGALGFADATYYNSGTDWVVYILNTAAGVPAGTYYLWARMPDGVGRLASGPLAQPGTIAPDGTLTGLPSTIAAGQSLSAATYGQTTGYFVLYRVAGAVEEGLRWGTNVMPGNLGLLIPQTAGAYTVRGYDAVTAGNKVYESAQFNVTAAPGALPATPTRAADTGTTSTGTTMNWTSTATSYRVLARPGIGTAYGSLADTTVSTNSYTFTGLAPGSSPRAVVIPQNGNGFGTPSGQFIVFLPS